MLLEPTKPHIAPTWLCLHCRTHGNRPCRRPRAAGAKMLAALARSQAPAASTCWSVVASALPGVRALAAAATAAGAAAPAAAAPAAAPWQLRFDGIAPGSVLRFDLPHTAADLEVRVGEHEAIELAASLDSLEANCSDHAAHPGAALGERAGRPCAAARKPFRLPAHPSRNRLPVSSLQSQWASHASRRQGRRCSCALGRRPASCQWRPPQAAAA